MELSFRRPDVIAEMDSEEREKSVKEDDDLCTIYGNRFFIRAVLPLPIESTEEPYRIWLAF